MTQLHRLSLHEKTLTHSISNSMMSVLARFKPLASIPDGKKVVLGLVTTKSPKLENKSDLIGRVRIGF